MYLPSFAEYLEDDLEKKLKIIFMLIPIFFCLFVLFSLDKVDVKALLVLKSWGYI